MIVILLSEIFTKTSIDDHIFQFSIYLLNCMLSLYIVKFLFDFYLLYGLRTCGCQLFILKNDDDDDDDDDNV